MDNGSLGWLKEDKLCDLYVEEATFAQLRGDDPLLALAILALFLPNHLT